MRRILVIAPNWIGDCLLAQPLLARLQERFPQAEIDALGPAWVAPVLERMPQVARAIPMTLGHGELKLGERWRLARALAPDDYEAAYVLPNSFKSALIPFFAAIPRRVGFVGEARYGLLNERHVLDEKSLPLMAERYAALGEPRGNPPRRPLVRPQLRVDEGNRTRALASLDLNTVKPIVAMCPGAEYGPAKRWPARHFASLAIKFAERGRQVWLFGSNKDRQIATEVASLSGGIARSLAGRTELASAIDLLSLAELVVTNDSGLMHVAAALNRRIVALYGSSSPAHTPPMADRVIIARLGIECSPCFKRECPLEGTAHLRCLNDLTPQWVLNALAATVSGGGKTTRN